MKKSQLIIPMLLALSFSVPPIAYAEPTILFRFMKSAGQVMPLNGIVFDTSDIYVGDAVDRAATISETGNGAISWKSTGELPDGLTFSSDGRLHGIALRAGSYGPISFTATDSLDQGATSGDLSIGVYSLPTSNDIVANIAINQARTVSFDVTGGAGPISASVISGSLPDGMQISGNGISGTPTRAGRFEAVIEFKDRNNKSTTSDAILEVLNDIVISSSFPDAYIGSAYSGGFTASGGSGAFVWTLNSSEIPGLSFGSSGHFSGSPSSTGNYSVAATLFDHPQTKNATGAISVFDLPALLAKSYPDAYKGSSYAESQPTLTGGRSPFRWSASGLPSGFSINSSTGAISAASTIALAANSPFNFTVSAEDVNGRVASSNYSITARDILGITSGSPVAAIPNQGYSTSFSATGGKTPYVWSKKNGTFPTGLNLASNGTLSGTPTQSGIFSFSLLVTDANNRTAEKALSIKSAAELVIAGTTLPDGYVNEAYPAFSFTSVGGIPAYKWTVTGSLPAGLSMAENGSISGTPTSADTATYTVTVTDGDGVKASANKSISTYALPLISSTTVPDAYAGSALAATQLLTTGGKGPFTWSVSAGATPSGLTLSTDGKVSGTPSAAGAYSFTARAVDANGKATTKAISGTVHPALVVATAGVPDAYLGAAYSATLSATGGKPGSYTWLVTAGSLPAGISLSSAGVLSGTPSAIATSSFTVQARDSNGTTATRQLSLTVNGTLGISSTLPASMATRATANANVTVSGGKAPFTITVTNLPTGLSYSNNKITGTATVLGSKTVAYAVTDANGKTASLSQAINVTAGTIAATMTAGNGAVTLQQFFNATDWADVNVNKQITLPAGSVRGSTTAGSTVVTIGGTAWGGSLTFTVAGEIQGASGAAGNVGGNAFNANRLGNANQKLNLVVNGAIRAGGGGGGIGGKGGTGGGGYYTGTTSREPASGDLYTYSTSADTYWSGLLVMWKGQLIWSSYMSTGAVVINDTTIQKDGYYYYRGSERPSADPLYRIFGVYRAIQTTINTNGGAGGSGGAGGRGQGYTLALTGGSAGAAGSAGDTNAGTGGRGGTGGTGGGWGATGNTGATGATGSNGNRTNGVAGSGGTAGAAAGFGIQNPGNVIRTGAGAVQGR